MKIINSSSELLALRAASGIITVDGDLKITCDIGWDIGKDIAGLEVSGDFITKGNMYCGGTLKVGGRTDINGRLECRGSVVCGGNLYVRDEFLRYGGSLYLGGSMSINNSSVGPVRV